MTAPAGHKLNSTVQKVTIVLPRDADKDIQVKFTDEPIYCQHSLDVQKINVKYKPISGVIFKAQYFDED